MICKDEMRKRMRAERRKVAPAARAAASAAVCDGILARADVRAAVAGRLTFAVYLATSSEIDLSPLVERLWAAKCPVCVPAWRGDTYVLADYSTGTRLAAGRMGILEPLASGGQEHPVAPPMVWIVPGLAFTRDGARLGYGGGWYDRFLSTARSGAVSLGVAYPFQIVDEIQCEEHDVALTGVVVAEGVQ